MPVEADSRAEAVSKLKAMMTEDMIAEHMQTKHPGEPVPSVADIHAMIEQKVEEVE